MHDIPKKNHSMWSQNSSLLHSAVLHGDKIKVHQMINDDIDINTVDRWQRTPLCHAVHTNNPDMVEVLLKANANLDSCDIHQRSLLHVAAGKGYHLCLKVILSAMEETYVFKNMERKCLPAQFLDDSGIHPFHLAAKLPYAKCLQLMLKYSFLGTVNCQDKNKRTPLHWAAAHGSVENVLLLLKHKAFTGNVDDEEKLAVHWAVFSSEEGSSECLQALLSINPSSVNQPDSSGATPLHMAILAGNAAKIGILLSNKKCDVNATDSKDQTPLHYACSRGLAEIVELLISSAADINKKDIFGATAMHYAALNNHSDLMEVMLQQPELKESLTLEDDSPLHWSAMRGSNAALVLLRSRGGSLTKRNREGQTALHIAAKKTDGFSTTVDVLLKMKAPIQLKATDGCTPLHYASQEGNMKIVKQLLKTDPSCISIVDGKGKNALHHAALRGHLHLTQILIEAGLPIDSTDAYGRSCLHLAAFVGFSDVLCLLLENKASVNERDNEGKTALHWACQYGHTKAVQTLLDHDDVNLNFIDVTKDRLTALDYAVASKRNEITKLLTECGALTSKKIQEIATSRIQQSWKMYEARKRTRYILAMKNQFTPSSQSMEEEETRESCTKCDCVREPLKDPQLYHCDKEKWCSPKGKGILLLPLTNTCFSSERPMCLKETGSLDDACPDRSKCGNDPWKLSNTRSLHDSSIKKLDHHNFRGKILKNDVINISVRLADEELVAARNAWRERLAGFTLKKIGMPTEQKKRRKS